MKNSLHTKIGENEETISFDFQSESKTDCAIVEKYAAAFNGYFVTESTIDRMDSKKLIEKNAQLQNNCNDTISIKEGYAMKEKDVYNLISLLGRDTDKTFAEVAGDSLRKIISKLSQDESSVFEGLIIDFGLKSAIEILESSINFVETANEAR